MDLRGDGRHFAGTCAGLVLRHAAAKVGAHAPAELVRRSGVRHSLEELHDDTVWLSYGEFRALLEATAALLGSQRCFDDMYETVSLVGPGMPEATEMLQALGSPGALYRSVEGGNGIMSVITGAGIVHELGPTEFDLGHRFLDGFASFPEFCSFMIGLDGMTPKLFGLGIESIEESTCVRRGDDHCAVRVRWEDPSDQSELELLRMKLALAEARMDAFRETVTDLVSDDDLETVLRRAVASAARAMRAPGFVLALHPLPWRSPRVFAHGIDDLRAHELAAAMLDDGAVEACAAQAVEVASTKRSYGKLVAFDPFDNINTSDVPVLRAYARLAATALDSAMALEDSRRQAARARALLELSSELSDILSTEEMATKVARATPMVIDCDTAAVVLIDDDDVARVRGLHGLPPDLEHYVLDAEFPVDDNLIDGFRLYTMASAHDDVRSVMQTTSSLALATVPVTVDAATAGCLVVGVSQDASRLIDNPELSEQLRGLAGQVSIALRNARLLDQIRHQAMHDGLTGLPNRSLILDRAEQLLALAHRSGSAVAALFIDLDGFKEVNDTLGHAAGDQLLQAVAERLRGVVRDRDTVARLGGDEFVILTEGGALCAGPELVAQRILDVLHQPFHVAGSDLPVWIGASIGIALGGRGDARELIRDADVALYEAKAAGKGRYVVFTRDSEDAWWG